jgi:hypothetical protein
MGTSRYRSSSVLLAAVVTSGLLALAAPAEAATLVVPTGFPTIQDAVDAAVAGDTIKVKAGVHPDEVFVDSTKTDLTITGPCPTKEQKKPKPAILDVAETATSTAVNVDADDVTIKCLLIRHGEQAIDADANGLTVDRLTTINSYINIVGDGFVVKRSTLIHGPDAGGNLKVEGANGRITNNKMRDGRASCMDLIVSDTLVSGNRMENCDGGGVDEDPGGSGNTYEFNVSTNMRGVAFEISSDGAVVRKNSATNTSDRPFDINADGAQVIGNVAHHNDSDDCFEIDGADMVVRDNQASDCDRGMDLSGGNAEVVDNTVTHAPDDDCFEIDGENMHVEGNRGKFCNGGFDLSGDDPVVLKNQVTAAGDDDGFNISCDLVCGAGRVEKNFTEGTNSDDDGFEIIVSSGSGAGFRVVGNTSQINAEVGISVTANEGIVQDNVTRLNGGSDSDNGVGLEVVGNDNLVSGNTSVDNSGDGFRLSGDGNTYTDNVSKRNTIDGFHLTGGTGSTLDSSTAAKNHGEGIENDATDSVITGNTSSGNRLDCAGDLPPSDTTGTVCADGSDFTAPGVVD